MRFVAEPYKAELIAAFFSSFKIDTSKRVFVEIEEFDMKTELASQLLNSSEREGNHQPERSAAIDLVRNGKATYRGHSILSRSGIRSSIQTFKSGRKATPIVADPVLGADNVTIDLVVESGGIRSQVSIHDRLPTLLGIQKRDDDISSVCFVTGTIQPLSIHYVSTEKRNPKADTEFGKKVTIQKSAESSLPPFQVSRQFRKAQPPFYRISQNGKLQLVNQRPQTFYYRVPPWVFNDWCEIIDSRSDEKKVDSSTNEAQTFFESKGIVFTKGTSASYDSDSSLLQITQTAKELAAIDAYFTNMGYQTEKQIMVRLETYRVHPGHAIQLLESARSESNHQPERDAIRKAAEQGHAELVDFQSHTLNGAHRASFGIPEDQKTDEVKKNPSPHFLVDAVLGADTHSVDAQLSYYLERQINELKTGHQIETLLTLNKGDYAIVGNWCNKD
ncbi:MAG: hypothetical protein P1V20_32120, partial [Verrucomicrobiales bacterium]|nr:hypothetical protein [Verrucomicrobiales bacterium]